MTPTPTAEVTTIMAVLGRGLLWAGVSACLAWGTVEWTLTAVKRPQVKRLTALGIGVAAVVIFQEAGLVSFGGHHAHDLQARLLAGIFGLLGGGLAPLIHPLVKRWVPIVTKTKG